MSRKDIKNDKLADSELPQDKEFDKTLRKIAEKIVSEKSDKNKDTPELLSPEAAHKLIHELEIHRVELEMQNNELRRIQDELEKSREWYFELYDFAPVGYFTLTEKGLIVEANLTAALMLDVKRNTLSRQPFTRFIVPEDQDIYYLNQKNLYKTGTKQLFEIRLKKNDDSQFWIRMETTLSYGENDLLTCRATISDISEIKKLEEEKIKFEKQIIQSQRLESLGILAGGIAHNFNNLLTGIFGYIDLADVTADNPAVSRYLNEALNMSERARGLTEHLLTFSRGGAPIRKTGHILPLIRESAQFALSGSDIGFNLEADENLFPCNVDAARIRQAVDNIILNARQAMTDGGIINVSAGNIFVNKNEIASLPEGMYVRISIKDYGTGIRPEILSKIFDPFFTTGTIGSGLGLAISYSIIIQHDGIITVDSEPGKGSRFDIYLPAVMETIQPPEDKHIPGHRGNGTIIIMDDEECIRDSLSEMLMSMGYDVIHMEEGDEVVSFLKEENNGGLEISGIILDLIIPGGMGGKTAAAEVRKILPDIPIFAISGYTDDSVMLNPRDFGFTSSLSKPFRMSELSELMNKHFSNIQ